MGNETSSNQPTPSETPTSEQLSELSVSSRRKSSLGSILQQTPEEPPAPDLSHLTEEEIAQINSVISRAKQMQDEEEDRVRKLEEDYASYAQSVVHKRSVAEQEHKGENLCPICHKVELLTREDGTRDGQNVCVDCERIVCDDCGLYETSLATKDEEDDGERPNLARSSSAEGYDEIREDEKKRGKPAITRQTSLPSDIGAGAASPSSGKEPSARRDPVEHPKAEDTKSNTGSQGHSRLKGVGQGTKSDSEPDLSDFASDVDMEDLTFQRVRGDGSSQEDVSDEYSLMSIVSTTTDDTEDYFRIPRRPRPRSLNLSRSHSATSSDDDTENTEYSGARLSDEEADLDDIDRGPDQEEFRRALEGLSAMAEERDDQEDFPPSSSMHVSIPRTHSLNLARAENSHHESRRVYSPSPPRSPSWREGLESPPFSPRRKDSYPGRRRSSTSPVSPKDKRHFFNYTDISPPSRQISLDELYGEDHGMGEHTRLHGVNLAQRPSPLSPDEVRESFTSHSGELLQLDKPVKLKRGGDSEGSSKSRKYKDRDSIGVVDLASFAATVASNTANLTSMSVSPTNLRVVEDLHHTDQLSPESQTSTDSTSPSSPSYSDEHQYVEDVDDIELADPSTKPIDYQNSKRQKQRPPPSAADWSPVVDLSPILDVSPSVEEAEQEDMLAQQEALRMRMERVSNGIEEDEESDKVEKVEFIDGDDDHDYQELNLVRASNEANEDDDDFMITPLKRYQNIEDMSQIDNGNLYEKAEAFSNNGSYDDDGFGQQLPALYELPELCATSNFEAPSFQTVTYSSVSRLCSGEEGAKIERIPERGIEMVTFRRSEEMECLSEINGNVTGWAAEVGDAEGAVAKIPPNPHGAQTQVSVSSASPIPTVTTSSQPTRVRRKLPQPTPEIVATQKKPTQMKTPALTAWLSSSLARSSPHAESGSGQVLDKGAKVDSAQDEPADEDVIPNFPNFASRLEMFEKLGSSKDEEKAEPKQKPALDYQAERQTVCLVKQDSFEKKRAKDLKAKPNPLVIKHIEEEEQSMSPQYKVMVSPVTPERKIVRRDYSGSGSMTPNSSPEHEVHIYPSPVSPLDSDSSPPKPQSPSSTGTEQEDELTSSGSPFTFSSSIDSAKMDKPAILSDKKPSAPIPQPRPIKAKPVIAEKPEETKTAVTDSKPKPPPVKEKPKRIRRRLPSVPSTESTSSSDSPKTSLQTQSSEETVTTECTPKTERANEAVVSTQDSGTQKSEFVKTQKKFEEATRSTQAPRSSRGGKVLQRTSSVPPVTAPRKEDKKSQTIFTSATDLSSTQDEKKPFRANSIGGDKRGMPVKAERKHHRASPVDPPVAPREGKRVTTAEKDERKPRRASPVAVSVVARGDKRVASPIKDDSKQGRRGSPVTPPVAEKRAVTPIKEDKRPHRASPAPPVQLPPTKPERSVTIATKDSKSTRRSSPVTTQTVAKESARVVVSDDHKPHRASTVMQSTLKTSHEQQQLNKKASPVPSKRKVSSQRPQNQDDTEVASITKEAAEKEVDRIIQEAELYCKSNGVTGDLKQEPKSAMDIHQVMSKTEMTLVTGTDPRARRFPVEKDVDVILREELDDSDLLIDSLKSIYGVPITSAMKSLKRRIIEELKSATRRRRKQLEELEEIKALEYQIEQLKIAKIGEVLAMQNPAVVHRGTRRTLVISEPPLKGVIVHRTRSESPIRRLSPGRPPPEVARKGTGQRSMSPSRASSQVPQRRSRHRRQASDPSVVKFSPIKEDKDIEAAFQAKLEEPFPEKRFEKYSTDDSSQSGHSDAESSRSEPLNARYKKIKPSAYTKMFYSGKSKSVERLQPEYEQASFAGINSLPLLGSFSEPYIAEGKTVHPKLDFPEEGDQFEREERKYILQMEINKRKRHLEETARLQHELMRLTREPDMLYHSYDDIPIQHRSREPNRPIPTGIIRPLDDEPPPYHGYFDSYSQDDLRLYQEILSGQRPIDVSTSAQANYSSTEYLAHKQEEFMRYAYEDYTQYEDVYADEMKYREQRTRDWVPRHDRLDALAYPPGSGNRDGMSSSSTLPELYAHRSDLDFIPTRDTYVLHHSDTDTNSPASDYTPAMPLLDDVTTRSRKIIHSIGSRPNSAEFNFPGGVEDLLNAIHRVESDNSVDADEPIMKHMTEGGVTILKQLDRKKQPPPQEPRTYSFPTKRILLTRDPRDRTVRGNGIGMKIVGGKRFPGTHELVAYVQAIYPGGVAEQLHGELQEGDQVVEWNGVPLSGRTYEDVQHIISVPNGEIELLIRPGTRLSTKLTGDCCGKSSSDPGSCHSSYDNLEETSDLDEFERCFAEARGIDPNQLAAQLEGIQEQCSPVVSPISSPQDYTTPSMSSPCSTPHSDPASTTSERTRQASEKAPMLDYNAEMGDIQLQLSYDDYDNTLNVHIIQARNLLPKDMNGLSDPFVKVYLLPGRNIENKRRTKHIPKSLNPEWHQTIMFQEIPRDEIRRRVLEFTVWDYDRFKTNDFLGEVVIDLSDDAYLDNKTHWYPLSDHDENTSAELPKPTVLPLTSPTIQHKPGRGQVVNGKSYPVDRSKRESAMSSSEETFSQGLGRRKSLGNLLEVENKTQKKSMHVLVSCLLCCSRKGVQASRLKADTQPISRQRGPLPYQAVSPPTTTSESSAPIRSEIVESNSQDVGEITTSCPQIHYDEVSLHAH